MSATVAVGSAARRHFGWIYDARTDLLIGLSWVPIWLGWHAMVSGGGASSDHWLREGVRLALLVSFLHQPLTLGLVYGDARQFALHRRLFVVGPIVAVTVAVVAAYERWWIVVPVAAVWNTQHTVQQRYGLQRIYARKSGYGSARLDRAFAYLPMTAALLAVAAAPSTDALLERSGLGQVNSGAVRLLLDVRPAAVVLLVVAVAATVWVVAALVRQEAAAGARANPAKWTYQLSSLALLASIVVDPAAGFIGYVAAHAIEYFVIVYRTTQSRYGCARDSSSLLGRTAHTFAGRVMVLTTIAGAAWAVYHYTDGQVFAGILYAVGALHFTYDAVIWKLRRPPVAASFAIPKPAAPPMCEMAAPSPPARMTP